MSYMPGNMLVVVNTVMSKIEKGLFFMVILLQERREQKGLTENKHVNKSMDNIIPDSNKC